MIAPPDRSRGRWYNHIDVVLIPVVLLAMGAVKFSKLSPDQRREIELQARLEQVYAFEMDFYAKHKRFYDPRAAKYQSNFAWLRDYDCDVRMANGAKGFSVVARADFDGDGQTGVWRVDQTSPTVKQLAED